ncbi:MAG TPA: cupin domain-containing protein [Actinomycetales bacterium]|nr:cupin domain-containing protein [Actinomycetales bacterium]
MSYPPVRYTGSSGQHSAVLRSAEAPPDLAIGTTLVRYLATAAVTGGDYGLYRWDTAGEGTGPDPHFHRTISEAFFVLSGAMRLYDGRRWFDAGPGDFLHVPPGGVHAFRSESGKPASMLLLFTPGAPREAYFEALAEVAASGRELDEQERAELLRRHDQYMV